jgi:aspartyl-tRNA(Asn)/glutamyl-tRNA(Gln) amidotransferase subunit C
MPDGDFNVGYVAQLCRLELTAEETAQFQAQLSGVIEYMKKIDQLDLTGIEATAHAVPAYDVYREDVPVPSLPLEDVLRNAPQANQNQFSVTKVVE